MLLNAGVEGKKTKVYVKQNVNSMGNKIVHLNETVMWQSHLLKA